MFRSCVELALPLTGKSTLESRPHLSPLAALRKRSPAPHPGAGPTGRGVNESALGREYGRADPATRLPWSGTGTEVMPSLPFATFSRESCPQGPELRTAKPCSSPTAALSSVAPEPHQNSMGRKHGRAGPATRREVAWVQGLYLPHFAPSPPAALRRGGRASHLGNTVGLAMVKGYK